MRVRARQPHAVAQRCDAVRPRCLPRIHHGGFLEDFPGVPTARPATSVELDSGHRMPHSPHPPDLRSWATRRSADAPRFVHGCAAERSSCRREARRDRDCNRRTTIEPLEVPRHPHPSPEERAQVAPGGTEIDGGGIVGACGRDGHGLAASLHTMQKSKV